MKVPFIAGHPEAIRARRRFVEKGRSLSFGKEGESLEHLRARTLCAEILPETPVLEFHTVSCESEPFAIVVDETFLPLAKSLGLPNVVVMKFYMKDGGSLIGVRGGVSVEKGRHDDPAAYVRTQELVSRLDGQRTSKSVQVSEAFDILRQHCDYVNFQDHPSSFVPALAGENAYDHHGLKARRIE